MKLISYRRRARSLRRRQGWRDRRYVRSAGSPNLKTVIAGLSINEMEKLSATDPDVDLDQIVTFPDHITGKDLLYRT